MKAGDDRDIFPIWGGPPGREFDDILHLLLL
jgi:hypothetical protein